VKFGHDLILKRESKNMGYTKPIPLKKEDIKVGNKYYTCNYGGVIKVAVIKIFHDTNSVLVKVNDDKRKPFVRNINCIFDDPKMAKLASRDWEKGERKRKKKKENSNR